MTGSNEDRTEPDFRSDLFSSLSPTTPEHSALPDSLLDAGIAVAFAPDAAIETSSFQPTDAGMLIADRYTLVEKIGEGGMGTVWLASQATPVKRSVAIKLIKPGMDSRSVVARFNSERQALALMDHPNISKVLDGGMTDQGRPYFVMELVEGTPITHFCDQYKLTLRERLELFVPICNAIQHAHQKGLIHRDIKPSNILVAMYDGKAVPKVIDFGVAKATVTNLLDQSQPTALGMVLGTPEYMSPEQTNMNNQDIDTRCDVYSLGIVLYELLAGSPPFRRSELEKVGLLEVFRMICEVDPPLPSKKLSTAKTRANIAAVRRIEPDTLARILRSDMDWVVMKAIEKNRERRYSSASALGADIGRFLANEPVVARPPSRFYLLQKFAWRNRGTVAAAILIAAAVMGGAAFSVWFGIQARLAEQRASESEIAMRVKEQDARENLALAMEAVDRFCDRVASDPRLTQNDLRPLQQSLLQNAVEFQQEFLRKRSNSPDAGFDLAAANLRLARIKAQIGQQSEAQKYFEEGINRLRDYIASNPENDLAKTELANGLLGMHVF